MKFVSSCILEEICTGIGWEQGGGTGKVEEREILPSNCLNKEVLLLYKTGACSTSEQLSFSVHSSSLKDCTDY